MEEQKREQIVAPTNPELIYHYTNQSGLFGILDKKKIWGTHVRYLNDLQEVKAGEEAFRIVMNDRLISQAQGSSEQIVQKIDMALDIVRDCGIYVASFSAANEGDSLSLWRAYSSTNVGFSLGFSLPRLREATEFLIPATTRSQNGRWLSKVIYLNTKTPQASGSEDKSFFDLAFGILADTLRNPVANDDTVKLTAWGLAHFFPTIKDIGFKDEIEYRIVQVMSPIDDSPDIRDVEYRPGSFSVIPYVAFPLPLRGDANEPVDLRRIIVGPGPHPKEAIEAARMLLRANGLQIKSAEFPDGVEVVRSKIPYRNW